MSTNVDSILRKCSEEAGPTSKPWFVISVIGDTKSVVPSTWEKSNFQLSLIDAARGADDCWIFHKDGKGKLSHAVKEAVESYWQVSKHGSTGNTLDIFSRKKGTTGKITLFGIQPVKTETRSTELDFVRDHLHKMFRIPDHKYVNTHIKLLEKISLERVKIVNHNNKELKIMTAVIVLVAEGDLSTIYHVDKILQHSLPIVIVKGSGKASDVIAEYLEHGKEILKTDAPLLLGTCTSQDSLEDFTQVMKNIKAMKHLISVFDVTDPHRRSLSEVATDAVLRSWAVISTGKSRSRRHDSSPYASIEHYTANQVDDQRSSMESNNSCNNFAGSQRRETRGALSPIAAHLTTSGVLNLMSGKIWHIPSSFPLYFYVAYQIIQQHFDEMDETKKVLTNDLFGKAIEADKLNYVAVLLHEHNAEFQPHKLPKLYEETVKCKLCSKDSGCQHLFSVLETMSAAGYLFKGDFTMCLQSGREICAVLLHYPRAVREDEDSTPRVSYHDLLIWSLFAHRPQLAELFWKVCEDQLLTALLAYGVLMKMAAIAKETADQSVHEELVDHAKIFKKRSLDMQYELYKNYPNEAMELMTTEFSVWDINISPLKCAYYNDMYEFIADPCSQRCLNKIWYNKLGTNLNAAIKKGARCGKFQGKYALCRLLSAPFTKYLVNYLVFFLAIILYSAFLLTNLKEVPEYQMGGYEIFVYVWMASDIVEEYLVPMFMKKRPQKAVKLSKRKNDGWYRFRRYINNFWNVLDTVSYLVTFLAIALRFFPITLKWARRVYSFSLFLIYMRFLHVTLIYRKVGVYVILIKEMMKDLARFIVVLIVFMIAVGVMYHVNKWPNHPNMWPSAIEKWRIWQIMYLPYWQIYGEVSLEAVSGTDNENSTCSYIDTDTEDTGNGSNDHTCKEIDDWIVFVIAAFYMLLSNLLLVNLVIALFSARFEKVRTNSEKIWRYIRYSYIMDYRIRIPAVLNIVLRPVMILYWCICKKCRCREGQSRNSQVNEQPGPSRDIEMDQHYKQLRTLQSLCAVRCN